MAILFDFYSNPTPNGDEEQTPKFHARAVNRQTLDPDTLVSHICERSTLGKGDVLAMFSELNHEIKQQLLAGNRVEIPGLGYFSLSLQAPSDADPQSTRAQHLRVKRIEFRADAHLREEIMAEATFERSPEKKHSATLNEEEVDQLVETYLKDHPFITRQVLSGLCHLTKGTAQNHIKRLLEEGKLINTNTPHTPIYMWKETEHKKRRTNKKEDNNKKDNNKKE